MPRAIVWKPAAGSELLERCRKGSRRHPPESVAHHLTVGASITSQPRLRCHAHRVRRAEGAVDVMRSHRRPCRSQEGVGYGVAGGGGKGPRGHAVT